MGERGEGVCGDVGERRGDGSSLMAEKGLPKTELGLDLPALLSSRIM